MGGTKPSTLHILSTLLHLNNSCAPLPFTALCGLSYTLNALVSVQLSGGGGAKFTSSSAQTGRWQSINPQREPRVTSPGFKRRTISAVCSPHQRTNPSRSLCTVAFSICPAVTRRHGFNGFKGGGRDATQGQLGLASRWNKHVKTLQTIKSHGREKEGTYQKFCVAGRPVSGPLGVLQHERRRGWAALTRRLMWNSVCSCRTGSGRWRELAQVFTGDGGREETLWEHP